MRPYVWLLCCALLAAAAGGAARVVVIGDLHGDAQVARDILLKAGVMDEAGHWAADEPTTVVQLGDVTDRGPDPHGAMDMLIQLAEEAPRKGGSVVLLLGNHDSWMLQQDWRFVHPADIEAFGGVEQRLKAYSPYGRYGQHLRNRRVVHVVGDTVFCHAGLLQRWAAEGVQAVNEAAAMTLKPPSGAMPRWNDAVWGNDLSHPGEGGPIWTRQLVAEAQRGQCHGVEAALAALSKKEGRSIRRMVVGHTVQLEGAMQFFCKGMYVAADVGASRWMGHGYVTYLEILMNSDSQGTTAYQRTSSEASSLSRPRSVDEAAVTPPKPDPPADKAAVAAWYRQVNDIAHSMSSRFGLNAAGLLLPPEYRLTAADTAFFESTGITHVGDTGRASFGRFMFSRGAGRVSALHKEVQLQQLQHLQTAEQQPQQQQQQVVRPGVEAKVREDKAKVDFRAFHQAMLITRQPLRPSSPVWVKGSLVASAALLAHLLYGALGKARGRRMFPIKRLGLLALASVVFIASVATLVWGDVTR
eukprot:TRINITY_DN19240_c0_g1_i1.p1 TRINITY_DN19240_c0_g1~~TRINITY_DN19240_c0_g1_i1.p1  ORF type:complete len:527 (+),score=121.17 TRINITY_DN19240_c0_g1_i1:124-1704(+)